MMMVHNIPNDSCSLVTYFMKHHILKLSDIMFLQNTETHKIVFAHKRQKWK